MNIKKVVVFNIANTHYLWKKSSTSLKKKNCEREMKRKNTTTYIWIPSRWSNNINSNEQEYSFQTDGSTMCYNVGKKIRCIICRYANDIIPIVREFLLKEILSYGKRCDARKYETPTIQRHFLFGWQSCDLFLFEYNERYDIGTIVSNDIHTKEKDIPLFEESFHNNILNNS